MGREVKGSMGDGHIEHMGPMPPHRSIWLQSQSKVRCLPVRGGTMLPSAKQTDAKANDGLSSIPSAVSAPPCFNIPSLTLRLYSPSSLTHPPPSLTLLRYSPSSLTHPPPSLTLLTHSTSSLTYPPLSLTLLSHSPSFLAARVTVMMCDLELLAECAKAGFMARLAL